MSPVHVAFLGCGFIAGVHARHLRALGRDVFFSFASRDRVRAESYRRRFGGRAAYGSYDEALADASIDAVVVAVPPRWHLDWTLRALDAGKHALVEKPAFPRLADFRSAMDARARAGRIVMVAENDHYKPLATTLRRVLAEGRIGDLLLAELVTVARRPKPPLDWRHDPDLAGGDAFFEEGIHWLHLAGSLGPRIHRIQGVAPRGVEERPGERRRRTSMLVAFQYEGEAAGVILYSREVPSLLRGIRVSKLYGREGVITFESNGGFVLVRGRGRPRLVFPGFRDVRGYRAMYRDFLRAIRTGEAPRMSLERAAEDQGLMEEAFRTAEAWTRSARGSLPAVPTRPPPGPEPVLPGRGSS